MSSYYVPITLTKERVLSLTLATAEDSEDTVEVEHTVSMSWADGMEGVLPVFNTKADALKYAGNNAVVLELPYERCNLDG